MKSLSRLIKNRLICFFSLLFIVSTAIIYLIQNRCEKKVTEKQLAINSKAVVHNIITEFEKNILLKTKYISNALNLDRERISPKILSSVAVSYGAEEIALVEEDGYISAFFGRDYGNGFNAKRSEEFRRLFKKLFDSNEAICDFDHVRGMEIFSAGKMLKGGTVFVRYSPSRVEYLFASAVSEHDPNFMSGEEAFTIVADEKGTVVNGRDFSGKNLSDFIPNLAELSSIKSGTLQKFVVGGKNSYLVSERYDDYTVFSVVPKSVVDGSAAKNTLALAILEFFVLFVAYFFVSSKIDSLALTAKKFSDELESEKTLVAKLTEEKLALERKIDSKPPEIKIQGRGETQKFNLMETVVSTVKRVEPLASEKNLKFLLQIDPTLPTFFKGDGEKIAKVLLFLSKNSVRMTSRGMVAVRVEPREVSGKNGLRFTVVDTGTGFKSGELQKLNAILAGGEPSFEAMPPILSSFKKLKQFLDCFGGTVRLKSEFSKGSLACFDVPCESTGGDTCEDWSPDVFKAAKFDSRRSNLKNLSVSASFAER